LNCKRSIILPFSGQMKLVMMNTMNSTSHWQRIVMVH